VFGLSIEIAFRFVFVAAMALGPARKVVILTLAAHPATVWKLEVCVGFGLVLSLLFVLRPLGRALVSRRLLFF
jgi:hypothetical protein